MSGAAFQMETSTVSVPIVIRLCEYEDLRPLEWFGAFSDHREIIEDAFERQLRGENLMLVADLNGFPVGQAWVDLASEQAAKGALIWGVRVFPFLQGCGLGRQLMAAAERVAREADCRFTEVGVERENTRAYGFYLQLGYRQVGEKHDHYTYYTPAGLGLTVPLDLSILRKPLTATEVA